MIHSTIAEKTVPICKWERSCNYCADIIPSSRSKRQAHVYHGGKLVYLGTFATAEEAALCVARIPEGQTEEARRQARQQARAGELTQLVALLVKEEEEEGSAEGSGYNY